MIFMHYIFFLNFEIIFKIGKASSLDFRARVWIYHILSILLSALLILLLLLLTDFGEEIKVHAYANINFQIVVGYISIISLFIWIFIGWYLKSLLITKSRSLLLLIILSALLNLMTLFGLIIPQLLYFIDLSDKYSIWYSWVTSVTNSVVGILQFVFIILNKRCLTFIHHAFWEKKSNKTKSIKSYLINENKSFNKMLLDINHSIRDGGMLSDLFDKITQQVRKI